MPTKEYTKVKFVLNDDGSISRVGVNSKNYPLRQQFSDLQTTYWWTGTAQAYIDSGLLPGPEFDVDIYDFGFPTLYDQRIDSIEQAWIGLEYQTR